MSGWQVGDIAICVKDCQFRDPRCRIAAQVPSIYYAMAPRQGDRFTVDAVEVRELGENYEHPRAVYLAFRESPSNVSYLADCFKKITPPREMIEQERKVGVPA